MLGFAVGTPLAGRVVAVAHGAAGWACCSRVVPWKTVVVRRARAKPPQLRAPAAAYWLTGLVAVCVVSGVLHAAGAAGIWATSGTPIAALQVHVGAAIVLVLALVAHTWGRHQRPRRVDLSRRTLLGTGALAGGSLALWALTEGVWRVTGARARGAAAPAPTSAAPTTPPPCRSPSGRRTPSPTPPAPRSRSAAAGGRSSSPWPTWTAATRCGPGWTAPAAGTPTRTGAAPPWPAGRRPPRRRRGRAVPAGHLGHRVLPADPAARRRRHAAGHARRRPAAVAGPRRAGAAGRPRPARRVVGQVGGPGRGARLPLVAAAAVPAAVSLRRGCAASW